MTIGVIGEINYFNPFFCLKSRIKFTVWFCSEGKWFLLPSVVTSLMSLWFLTFSIAFQKLHYSPTWKKIFLKIIFCILFASVLISTYDFSQAFWLNLTTLWAFSIVICYLMLALNFLYVWRILFYHASWLKVFQILQFSLFQVKMINHCKGHIIIWDIEHQLQENILYHYQCCFLWNLL